MIFFVSISTQKFVIQEVEEQSLTNDLLPSFADDYTVINEFNKALAWNRNKRIQINTSSFLIICKTLTKEYLLISYIPTT